MPTLFVLWNSDDILLDHLQVLVDNIQHRHPTEECAAIQIQPFEVIQPFSTNSSTIFSSPYQPLLSLFVLYSIFFFFCKFLLLLQRTETIFEELITRIIDWLESDESNIHSPFIQIIFVTTSSMLSSILNTDPLFFQKSTPFCSMNLQFKIHVLCKIDKNSSSFFDDQSSCTKWCTRYHQGQLVLLQDLEPIQKLVKEESKNPRVRISLINPLKQFLDKNCL